MAASMTIRALTEAILDAGIQNTNFFNGRILNAGDLQTDQEANREQHEQLGAAIGAGVVRGLWVELATPGSGTAPPVVSIGQGLAFNANGQAVALPLDVQVALTSVASPLPVDAGLFTDCVPPSTSTVPLQAGIYILVATPASGFSGRAPMFSFGDVTAATGCGSRYAVEGVRFRLVQLDVTKLTRLSPDTRNAIAAPTVGLMSKTDAASLSKLRNWLAHLCLGTEEAADFPTDPFSRTNGQSPYLTYGAIDALLAAGELSPGDVPLAQLYWTVQGVQFLDRWSVRRRAIPPPVTTTWPLPDSARRRALAEATFLQFQEQVDALRSSGAGQTALAVANALDYFRYLPPAGFLPLAGGSFAGFTTDGFFAQIPHRDPDFIDGEILGHLVASALAYPPRDPADGELLWVYRPWQNAKAIDSGSAVQPYLVFASGQMPPMARSRFDTARWNYANYPDLP
jgi:hypothetical protein